jgi:hypothetical protein
MTKSWSDYVHEALMSVTNGQHLRFINPIYRTREVCVTALMHETSHNSAPYDVYCISAAIIEEVVAKIKQARQHNKFLYEYLNKVITEIKSKEANPGYYGKFESLQALFDNYKVTTYDGLLEALFLERYKY